MPLDFGLMGTIALALYASAYIFLHRRLRALNSLLSRPLAQPSNAKESFVMGWAFRGRGEKEDRLAHLFTILPALMNIIAFVSVVLIFLIAFAFLKIQTSIGTFVVALMLSFPFYHAADSIEMYLVSRAAERAGLNRLSEEDVVWLDGAAMTMTNGMRYFGLLSFSIALVTATLGALELVTLNIPVEILWFGLLVSTVVLNTMLIPKVGFNPIKGEADQTLEVGLPIHGDHLSYGGPIALNAHRARLMRRFRKDRPTDNGKNSKST